jgi:hypothetical protein
MVWKLWLDDEPHLKLRSIPRSFVGAVSSTEAIELVKKYGPPTFMDLDHDLGGDDTAMKFLYWLRETHPDNIPSWSIHSMNPVGRNNINSFMENWEKRGC